MFFFFKFFPDASFLILTRKFLGLYLAYTCPLACDVVLPLIHGGANFLRI